jgi:hypothetical protein
MASAIEDDSINASVFCLGRHLLTQGAALLKPGWHFLPLKVMRESGEPYQGMPNLIIDYLDFNVAQRPADDQPGTLWGSINYLARAKPPPLAGDTLAPVPVCQFSVLFSVG